MWQKLAALGIAVIGFNLFLFNHQFLMLGSVGMFLTILWVQAWTVTAFVTTTHTRKQSLALAASGLAIITAAVSLFRANEIDITLLTLTSWSLTAASLYLFALQHQRFGALSELFIVPIQVGFSWIMSAFQTLEVLPRWLSVSKDFIWHTTGGHRVKTEWWSTALRAAVITVPLLVVIGGLLTIADPIFSKTINQLFFFQWPKLVINIPVRIVQTLLVAAAVIPFLVLKITDRFVSPLQHRSLAQFRTEMAVAIGSVSALIGLFLLIQFRYLFASVPETELHQFGIATYSEYVRRGFSELVVVACLVYGLVGASLAVVRQDWFKNQLLRNLNIVLLAEGLVFIFSIFRRVLLYQAEHGLTRVRLYGSLFLVVLIALTIVLLLRHLVKGMVNWYQYEVALVVAGILGASLLNTDRLIATVFQPSVNDQIDYVYISRLSGDGVEGWLDTIAHSRSVLDALPERYQPLDDAQARDVIYTYWALNDIVGHYNGLALVYGSESDLQAWGLERQSVDWQTANLGEAAAYRTLRRALPLTDLNLLKARADQWYWQLTPEQVNRPFDRSQDTPLLD